MPLVVVEKLQNPKVTVLDPRGRRSKIEVKRGETLRQALLRNHLVPYGRMNRVLNCYGLGICGTCWVNIDENGTRWPRRSCQIRCYTDLEVELLH